MDPINSPRKGFETEIKVPPGVRYAQAFGLDKNGGVLGKSKIIDMQTGKGAPGPEIQLKAV